MRKLLTVLVVMALMLGLVGTTSAAAPTTVYLVNTLRTVLDVYVDGNLILEDLAPATIRGPFAGEINQQVWIQMIPANTVLGEDNGFLYNISVVMTLPAGKTVALVTEPDNIPGSLGSLDIFIYDFAKTGPGQSRLMVHNALYDDDIEIVLFPGTANEQHLPTFGSHFQTRLPAVPTIASVVLWGRAPLPTVFGPFNADLQPGKLYVVFVSGKAGGGLQMLNQEFNVGQ